MNLLAMPIGGFVVSTDALLGSNRSHATLFPVCSTEGDLGKLSIILLRLMAHQGSGCHVERSKPALYSASSWLEYQIVPSEVSPSVWEHECGRTPHSTLGY